MSISIPSPSLRGSDILPGGPTVVGTPTLRTGVPSLKPLPLFRDSGKSVNDLFKLFPNNYRVEINTPQDNGLKFSFAAERRQDRVTNATSMFVSSQARCEIPSSGVVLVGTIDSEKLEGEVTLSNLGLSGIRSTFKGKFLENDKNEVSGEVAYASSSLSGALGLFYKDDRSRLESQVSTTVTNNLSVGALASLYLPNATQEAALDNVQLGVNYFTFGLANPATNQPNVRHDFNSYIKAARNAKLGGELAYTVGTRVFYRQDLNTVFGADVSYTLQRPFKELDAKFVAERRFDSTSTGRVAIERSGKVRLALASKLSPNLTFTLGADVNALRIEEHSVGATINFTGN